jgi:energy-coupling factor transporter transmembrane protein EcfT
MDGCVTMKWRGYANVAAEVPHKETLEDSDVGLILLGLLLVLIFAGAGFALHVLWIIAVVLLAVWLLGFLVGGSENRWYRVKR